MNYTGIPTELKELPQWVCVWKETKVPMQTGVRKPASSSDPSTWSDFDTAVNAVETGMYNQIGFVFADNGVVGIDIDKGYDDDGFLSACSINIMRACQSYTEKSRSGRGQHIFVKGKLPFCGKNNQHGVEIYQSKRYFIMTGEQLIYNELIENQVAIDYVLATYFKNEMRELTGNSNKGDGRIYTPKYSKPEGNGKIRLRPQYPPIQQGGRNISLASIAGQMHRQGYQPELIYKELAFANEKACQPPLPEYEVLAIVDSVTSYKRSLT